MKSVKVIFDDNDEFEIIVKKKDINLLIKVLSIFDNTKSGKISL
jgi:hypothetical protein